MNELRIRVSVIAGAEKTAQAIRGQLDTLLGRFIKFSAFSLKEWLQVEADTDLVLVSTYPLARQVAQTIKAGTEIIITRRTLLKHSWEKIQAIPSRTKLMLVNDDQDSAVETIALLYELGARHIDLIPVYPGLQEIPNLEAAITPGEVYLVPEFVKEVIDIGDRVVDVSTMVELLTRFDLMNGETRSILAAYAEQIISRSQGLQVTMQGLVNMKNLLQKTLDIVQDGIIAYDEQGIITIINRAAEQILSIRAWEVVGLRIEKLLEQKVITVILGNEELKDILIQVGQQNIIFNKLNIENGRQITGGVLTLQVATKVEELEMKLRSQLKARGHKAKYSFRDLISKSEKMERTVSRAQKVAGSDLAVLILGESGTGKELFAQAIHNASPRRNFPFVAVNCSALPDNLLESELFGYEDGAFTGARKGGKPGLFEQAHKGTIFLDEIGDISAILQSRLLRVIQEKEVLKVGGTSVLPVDVRIIAATNRNLAELAADGKFRSDLYYRLKVLQLELPPLRTRKEDIPILVEHFLKRRRFKDSISKEAMNTLCRYDWPGNVRELENTIDYLTIMAEGTIKVEEIPFANEYPYESEPAISGSQRAVPQEDLGINGETFILKQIYRAKVNGYNIGRRTLVALARAEGLILTEKGVRKIIENLSQAGLIEVFRGRSGCRLTVLGEQLFRKTLEVSNIN